MKKSEIKIGHIYSNGKGRKRLVVDFGPQYVLYAGQACSENLQYEIIHDGTKMNTTAGKRENMTLASFASWCKEDVSED